MLGGDGVDDGIAEDDPQRLLEGENIRGDGLTGANEARVAVMNELHMISSHGNCDADNS
jgi:hypothetical protein